MKILTLCCCLLLALPTAAETAADWSAGLPHGMEFLLEVTFMKIDVADVQVRMDDATAAAVAAVKAEGEKTDDRRDRVAAILDAAPTIAYGMTFQRSADQAKFLKGMLSNLEKAEEAGELTAVEHATVRDGLLALLAPHAERGGLEGDRMLFRIDGDAASFTYLGRDGALLAAASWEDPTWAKAFRAMHTGQKSKLRKKLGELPWRE